MNKSLDENIFNIVLLVIIGIAIVTSFSFNPTARAFPLAFGVICFVMVLLQVVVRAMPSPPKFLQFVNQKGALSVTESSDEESNQDESMGWGKYFLLIVWLVGYIALVWVADYLIGTLIFLIFFLRFAGNVTWKTTLIYSIAFSGSLYMLFEVLIKP